MSANSSCRRAQTAPIVSSRPSPPGGSAGLIAGTRGGAEALARPAPARAHDERRPGDPAVHGGGRLVGFLGCEGHRRLAALVAGKHGAALRAVVRGFRVLEAAL